MGMIGRSQFSPLRSEILIATIHSARPSLEFGKWECKAGVLIRVLGIESYRNSCTCKIIGPVLDPAMLVQGPEWPIRNGFEYEL